MRTRQAVGAPAARRVEVHMTIDLERRSLVDSLADALSNEILSGALAPGAGVTEQDVASRYGVARPTAKAAIERLSQSGLLRRVSNKPARVAVLGEEDIADLYTTRIFVEGQAVAALAVRGEASPDTRDALAAMRDASDGDAPLALIASDIRFHRALVDSLGSPRLSRMFTTIVNEAHLCMAREQFSPAAPEDNVREHAEILAAVEERDAARARQLMIDHLRTAAERLLQHPLDLSGWAD
jgi:DNA-binding GntR family transcriptional regulator